MDSVSFPDGPQGHRGRLRERFALTRAEQLHPYEVMELLLTFSIPRRDVKPIAKRLLSRFGGISGVLDANPAELSSVPGVGPTTASLLRLVKEIGELYLKDRLAGRDAITSPRRVADYCTMRLSGLPHEAFMVLFMNVRNEILESKVINEGTIDQVAVYPRRIIEAALAARAAGLILVHNHPSGHTDPSEEDKRLTRVIRDAARPLDVRVLDHVIVGKGGYYSFSEHGLL